MKPQVYCTYLYADGHAVIIYEKTDPDAGKVQFAEVHELYGPDCYFTGRVILYRADGLTTLVRNAYSVRATVASLKHGSQRTKELGIAVGYLEVCMSKDWHNSVTFYDLPGTLGGPYSYQPDTIETFDPDLSLWGHVRVARIHRVKAPAPAQEVAA